MAKNWKIRRIKYLEDLNQKNEISGEKIESELVEKEKINKPRGWHLRAEYIDSEGKIYHFGQLIS